MDDFQIPTKEEFAEDQKADVELQQLRDWIDAKRTPSADELAPLSGRTKTLAQLIDQVTVREGILVIRRQDDPERELTIVPSGKVEAIIRFYHEGPGGAHQAAKATSAKIIRCFWWPDLKRDVRLYIACCPTCEKFLQLNRTPRAGLRSMEVGGRGDCIAVDIVGGKESFPLTPRGNMCVLSIIDCFTRYAIAVPLPDQSAEVVIAALIGHYITIYGTPRRILSDQGRNFESEEFHNFCNLFRIHKVRTSAYHPQSNGVCERFNQTLKFSLRKILAVPQQINWDIYLNFAVFSYNLSVHSSTGFSPYYLTFGSEARLPPDLVFGTSFVRSAHGDLELERPSPGPISLLFKSFALLSRAFTAVRENTHSFHQREKDRYDLGAIERVFHPGDRVRVRLKARQRGPAKFQSNWSAPHEVLAVQGVVVTLRELSTGREYKTHHDRLSNPLFSGQNLTARAPEADAMAARDPGDDAMAARAHETDANPVENAREPEDDSKSNINPEEAIMRSRSGRVIRSTRDPKFEYHFMLPQRHVSVQSTSASPGTLVRSSSCLLAQQTQCIYSNIKASCSCPPLANPDSLLTVQMTADEENEFRTAQRVRLESLGERPQWISDEDGNDFQVVMLKSSGTIFFLDLAKRDWIYRRDGTTLTQHLQEEHWSTSAPLTNEEVKLPSTLEEIPGDFNAPRYGFKPQWRNYVKERAARIAKSAVQPTAPPGSLPSVVASLAGPGLTSPAPTMAAPLAPGASPLTALKVSTGTAWTSAQRAAVTTSSVASTMVVASTAAPLPSTREQPRGGPPARRFEFSVISAQTTTPSLLAAAPVAVSSTTQQLLPMAVSTVAAGTQTRPSATEQGRIPVPEFMTSSRLASESTGLGSGSTATSPTFTSLPPGTISHGPSTTGSLKPSGPQRPSTEEMEVQQLDESEEDQSDPLAVPMRDFLSQYIQQVADGTSVVALGPLMEFLMDHGYTFDEFPPPRDRPNQRVLSTMAYLQVVSDETAEVIPLNLQEFNQLVHDVVREQYSAVALSYHPRELQIERIRALAGRVVLDPTGILRGERPAESRFTAPSAAGPSASSAAALLPPGETGAVMNFLQGMASAAAAKFVAPPPPAALPKPAPGAVWRQVRIEQVSELDPSTGAPSVQPSTSEVSLPGSGAQTATPSEHTDDPFAAVGPMDAPQGLEEFQSVLAAGLNAVATPVIGKTPLMAGRKTLDISVQSKSSQRLEETARQEKHRHHRAEPAAKRAKGPEEAKKHKEPEASATSAPAAPTPSSSRRPDIARRSAAIKALESLVRKSPSLGIPSGEEEVEDERPSVSRNRSRKHSGK